MEYIVQTKEKPDEIKLESAVVFSYPAHIHTYSEMILYEPFDGTVIVNDRHIAANFGCAVLIVPSDVHRVVVNQCRNARYLKISFASQQVGYSAVIERIEDEGLLIGIFEEIRNCDNSDLYLRLLVQIAECIMQKKGVRISPVKKKAQNDLAIQAVRIIHECADKSISLNSIAKELFVSPQYLSKVFKETIGIGFSSFLSGVRLDRAADLLCKTQKSVTEICIESGFNNLSHFIRSFNRRFSCSPTVFRQVSRILTQQQQKASY